MLCSLDFISVWEFIVSIMFFNKKYGLLKNFYINFLKTLWQRSESIMNMYS